MLEAYLRGLERRVKKVKSIKNISSVASFFVSRVDTSVDKQLDNIIAEGGEKAAKAEALLHKAAIANSKLSYVHYQTVIESIRFCRS